MLIEIITYFFLLKTPIDFMGPILSYEIDQELKEEPIAYGWYEEESKNLDYSFITTGYSFYDKGKEIGSISWQNGQLKVNGDMDVTARLFFEEFMKPYLEYNCKK